MYTVAHSTNKWEILSPRVPQVARVFGQKVGWGPSVEANLYSPSPAKNKNYSVPPSEVCIRIFARVL